MDSPADNNLSDTAESGRSPPAEDGKPVNRESLYRDYLQRGKQYMDDTLVPERTRIQRYFEGDPNLNGDLPARERRSQFVSNDTRDVFNAILPQLVDTLLGSEESVVEFVPNGPEDAQAAKLATDYVNYLVRKHGGIELFIPVIQDALKSNVGIVRAWWDEKYIIEEKEFTGLDEAKFDAIQIIDPENEKTIESITVKRKEVNEQTGLIDCTLKIKRKKGEICLLAIPPEERIIDANATSLRVGQFTIWAHARSVPIGELRAMGYSDDDLEGLSTGDWFLTNEEAEKRENAGDRSDREAEKNVDPSMAMIPYAQMFVYGDLDDDGIPGLFYVEVAGAQCKELIEPKRVPDTDVAEFQTVPIEHVATGGAWLGNILDAAALRSALWRGTLDSLSMSIFPQRGFHDTMVNVQDLLNDEPGGLVRCKGPPGQLVQEFAHTFAGAQALQLIQYTDQMKEERTGVSRNSAGMDADALQSVAKKAAESVVSGAERQIKYVARILADYGGLKKLFKNILRLVVQYQKTPETVRLFNGNFATFDPNGWNPDMDCVVRTGLGAGTQGETLAVLDRIMGLQEKVAAAVPGMVTPDKIMQTADLILKETKYRDASRFFQFPPQPQPPPPPTPEELLAKAQMFDSETKRRSEIEKNINNRLQIMLTDDRERDKNEGDFYLKLAELAIKAGQPMLLEQVKQEGMASMQRQRSLEDYMNIVMAESSAGKPEQEEKQQAAQQQQMQAQQPQGAPQQ